jgi:phospholipase/carboxylesterase
MKELVLDSKTKTEKIIFVFHGYGASKENLLPVGEIFSDKINDAEVHVPDGLEICDAGFGYQWFKFDGNDADEWKKSFQANEPTLESYINDVLEKKKLDYTRVVFSGFSQGGMLSLALGLKLGVGAIVSFSGGLIDQKLDIASKDTKILMTHGTIDNVMPISEMYTAERLLKSCGITDVRTIVCNNVAHSIDERALCGAVDFINSVF